MSIQFRCLVGVLIGASALSAKDVERSLRWEELSNSLSGQEVTILQSDHKKTAGTLVQIDANELVLRTGSTSRNIPRPTVETIVTRPVFHRTRGRVIGTLVGAAVGIALVTAAATYANNENGSNADAIVGTCAGVAAGTTVLGYFAGREADKERTVIHVIGGP